MLFLKLKSELSIIEKLRSVFHIIFLYFQTTTTATTTTSLVTYCFSVQGAIAANCRRKKRAINDAPNNEGRLKYFKAF